MANSRGAAKRRKPVGQEEEEPPQHQQQLLPQLPDHLAQLCLSLVPPPLLSAVCRSWRRLIYSPSFPPFLSLYALLSSSSPSPSISFSSFDPMAATWQPLPPPPHLPHLFLRHPSFLSRLLSVQSVSVSGHLVLLAATTHCLLPALPRPLVFHPVSNQWRLSPRIAAPRRWCAAGVVDGSIYVASGVCSSYSVEVARSAQRWDLKSLAWENVARLKDGKFSREAVDAVGSEREALYGEHEGECGEGRRGVRRGGRSVGGYAGGAAWWVDGADSDDGRGGDIRGGGRQRDIEGIRCGRRSVEGGDKV